MSNSRLAMLCLSTAATLTACTSYRGADRLNDRLILAESNFKEVSGKDAPKITAAKALGVRQIFINDLQNAWNARAAGGEGATKANRLLAISGVSLIQVNCNEYFNEMGRNQRNSAVLRDLIAPVTAVINAAISLHLFGGLEATNQNIQLGFGAISAAGGSALDIYDRRFLFDSDNIAAVRSNTMAALSKNADETLSAVPGDFVQVIARLQQIENFCTPPEILSNVRASLKAAQFENDASDNDDTKTKPGKGEGEKPTTKSEKPSDSAFIATTPMN